MRLFFIQTSILPGTLRKKAPGIILLAQTKIRGPLLRKVNVDCPFFLL